jgi:hypothetical protein
MADDLASAAVKYLTTLQAVTSLVGSFPLPGDSSTVNAGTPFIFAEDLSVPIQGTSQAALVCSEGGGWQEPLDYSTAAYRRLGVEVFVDPQRDANLNVTESSAITRRRGRFLLDTVRSYLHWASLDPRIQVWGDLVIVGSQLLAEGEFFRLADTGAPTGSTSTYSGDGIEWCQVYFGCCVYGRTDAPV